MEPRQLANSICDTLQRNSFQALLVGGCVRDLLLHRNPVDFDVTTNATPEQVLQLFPEGLAVGAQFGVILIPHNGNKVEVATFRRDISYSDGRHPDKIAYATAPEEDVSRRDFTINGLLMRHNNGQVLDFVGGQADLSAGVIRAIGDPTLRFQEDKLRMLRAVRFAARFSYTIEPATLHAIQHHASEVNTISAERVRDELTKMLIEGKARRAFELLDATNLLSPILPEIASLKGVQQPPEYHPEGDVWIHTLLMLEGLPSGSSITLAWGILLHDVGKPPTFRPASITGDRIRFNEHVEVGVQLATRILRRLRFSNEESAQILALIANHMKFKDVSQMKKSTLKKFVRLPKFEEHLQLHRLDCLSSHGKLDAYGAVLNFIQETPAEEVHPKRLLTGDDLQALGSMPGPQFHTILGTVEDAQLEGSIQSKDEAVALVQRNYPLVPSKQ
jgi:poly(A) polymerase